MWQLYNTTDCFQRKIKQKPLCLIPHPSTFVLCQTSPKAEAQYSCTVQSQPAHIQYQPLCQAHGTSSTLPTGSLLLSKGKSLTLPHQGLGHIERAWQALLSFCLFPLAVVHNLHTHHHLSCTNTAQRQQ